MLYAENFVFFFCFEYCFKICFQYGCSSSLNSNLKSNYLKTEQQRFRVLSAIEKCLFLTLYFEKKNDKINVRNNCAAFVCEGIYEIFTSVKYSLHPWHWHSINIQFAAGLWAFSKEKILLQVHRTIISIEWLIEVMGKKGEKKWPNQWL